MGNQSVIIVPLVIKSAGSAAIEVRCGTLLEKHDNQMAVIETVELSTLFPTSEGQTKVRTLQMHPEIVPVVIEALTEYLEQRKQLRLKDNNEEIVPDTGR